MKTKFQKTKQILRIKWKKTERFITQYPFIFILACLVMLVSGVSFVKILDKTVKRRTMPIEYLVVHYTANLNARADARMNAIYLRNTNRAGAHYCIDDKEIIQCTEEHNAADAVGGRRWPGFVPKFWLDNKIKNNNSLSFEMCLGGGRNDSLILDRTAQCLAWQLVNKGLGLDHVVRHHDVTGKHCPRFCYTDEKWDQKREDAAWLRFKELVGKYHKIQLWRKKVAKEKAQALESQMPAK